jgi:hypothetical protein
MRSKLLPVADRIPAVHGSCIKPVKNSLGRIRDTHEKQSQDRFVPTREATKNGLGFAGQLLPTILTPYAVPELNLSKTAPIPAL